MPETMNLLDRIDSPEDLKRLSVAELTELSEEIRAVLLKRIAQTGGHMGSNLGFVEATVALHYVFDSPCDKFVFDVSHQSYTHKILTGRKLGYTDPAHYYDLSGYTTPSESEHDNFKVGHTSTSVSLASGLAKARDLKGGSENVVAILGDGSMSGGEAFEGLNNAAVLGSNFVLVFNDNEMSIAPNQGGMYANFAELRRTNGTAANNFFKTFGFDYLYVEEGNSIEALVAAFEQVKDIDHPVVVHLHTDKGRGCDWAEADKEAGHWALPASVKEAAKANPAPKAPSISELTGELLLKKMAADPTVITMSAATPGVMGVPRSKRAELGRQFIDVGIAEEHMVAMASGIAANGGKPVIGIYANFLQRTYDQLNQDLAMNNNPAVILSFGSGIGGGDCTHNGMYDIALTRSIPNLVGLAPATKQQYLAMLDWAIDQTEAPVVVRVPCSVVEGPELSIASLEDARKASFVQEGERVALVGLGDGMGLAQQVAELLEAQGIKASIVNPACYTSVDEGFFQGLAEKHELVATFETGVLDGGFGEGVAAFYGTSTVKVLNFGAKKAFNDLVPAEEITRMNHMTPAQAAEDILAAL